MIFVKGQVPPNKKTTPEVVWEKIEQEVKKTPFINGKGMAHWANVTNWFKAFELPSEALASFNSLLK